MVYLSETANTISDIMTQDLRNKEKCPRCGKNNLVTDIESGELFCSFCGMVLDEIVLDNGPERMFSDSAVNKARTGNRTSLARHDQGLSTIINPLNKDSSGKPLPASMKSSLKRLRVWDSRSKNNRSVDRNLQQALGELLKMKEKLFLSDAITEKAAYIYRKALEKKLIRGRSILAMVASALYAACRESGTPRTLNEVSGAINITKKDLSAGYRLIVKELDLKMPVLHSVSYVAKIASVAKLSEKTKRCAVNILKKSRAKTTPCRKRSNGNGRRRRTVSCQS